MSTVTETVQKILEKRFSLQPERLTPDATLEDLGLDSLDAIETLFDIEKEFRIRVPHDRGQGAKDLNTIQDFAELIERLVREQQSTLSTS